MLKTLVTDKCQDLQFCKDAYSQGARIMRLSPWDNGGFGHSFKYYDHHDVLLEVRSYKPNWTSKYGYRVDKNCDWWVRFAVEEFYSSRL